MIALLLLDEIRGQPHLGPGRDSLLALKGGEQVISFRTKEEAGKFRGTVDSAENLREGCELCGGPQKRIHVRVDAHPPPGAKIGDIITGISCLAADCARCAVTVIHSRLDG